MFKNAGKKASTLLKTSAYILMVAWSIPVLIVSIALGKNYDKTFLGFCVGVLLSGVIVITIRNSVLYKIAIMDACQEMIKISRAVNDMIPMIDEMQAQIAILNAKFDDSGDSQEEWEEDTEEYEEYEEEANMDEIEGEEEEDTSENKEEE